MPLSFWSLSHGEVAFGFFNIESDLLLLDNTFMFAEDFCDNIGLLADRRVDDFSGIEWEVTILAPEDIGDLHGAISGTRLSGFIGEVYGLFPFPKDPEAFKQNSDGFKTRDLITNLVRQYSKISTIPVTLNETNLTFGIGEYLFSQQGLVDLLNYVWLGGYPRWSQGIRPSYVNKMKNKVEGSVHPLFQGISLTKDS
jgi:hypothetical protein